MQKLGILFLESVFHLGGAERITYDIVTRLSRQKYEPVLCTLYHPGLCGEAFIRDGYTFYHDLMANKLDIRVIPRIKKIIKTHDIRLIYLINQPLTLFWGTLCGKLFGVPVVSALHNMMLPAAPHFATLYRLFMPHTTRLIAVAETQKTYWARNAKIPEDLITVISNGIDVRQFSSPSDRSAHSHKVQSLGIDPEKRVVGIVARLVPLKGVDLFLHAAKLVLESCDQVAFAIAGDGPQRRSLQSLASRLGVAQQVRFLGARTDVHEVIPVFDVAVLSSRTEALPMVILEYMAAERAIVATAVGSIPELLKDGETALLVEEANVRALADAILTLLADDERREQLGARALLTVKERFSIERTVRQTENLIDEVTAPSTRTA